MGYDQIIQMISSVGFPIVACIMCFARMEKQDIRHDEEVSKITESLNNNTVALTKLSERLTNTKGE